MEEREGRKRERERERERERAYLYHTLHQVLLSNCISTLDHLLQHIGQDLPLVQRGIHRL